ncbi:YchJ family protein [Agromyces italicus]|uniref:YchJ family protein n=1 Tax=Agromyces italicus TaxID=279572 RepID=UPI0003B67B9B|nr:YchJ family metal-binding protein [Agromyces italicus]
MPEAVPTRFPAPDPGERCPCLSGLSFGECCRRHLAGESPAPTAVQLMRSRYTAFVTGDADYLLSTWHPSTRPADLELDPSIRWYRLDIMRIERGGPLDHDGIVEFAAYYRHDGERGEQREVSRFDRTDGRWRYVDAVS